MYRVLVLIVIKWVGHKYMFTLADIYWPSPPPKMKEKKEEMRRKKREEEGMEGDSPQQTYFRIGELGGAEC